jgi:hypothetical protein
MHGDRVSTQHSYVYCPLEIQQEWVRDKIPLSCSAHRRERRWNEAINRKVSLCYLGMSHSQSPDIAKDYPSTEFFSYLVATGQCNLESDGLTAGAITLLKIIPACPCGPREQWNQRSFPILLVIGAPEKP